MILYRYRSIDSAIKEIDKETFHFATREELNDPIEGFVRVFWQGDKAAWEGLFRNYICSLSRAIDLYLIQADENMIHHKSLIVDLHRFDDIPLGGILKELGDQFLANEAVQKLASFYGTNNLKVQESEMRFILHSIHDCALILCISKYTECKIFPEKTGQDLINVFLSSTKPLFPFELMSETIFDPQRRATLTKLASNSIEDLCDFSYIKMGFDNEAILYGFRRDKSGVDIKEEKDAEVRRHRNWMDIAVDFPKLYVNQLKDMIYPESYIVCFSSSPDDSAMWGNYAEYHQGICFIYELDENNAIGISMDHTMRKCVAKKVDYEGKTIERNFFTTFGRLTVSQIHTWLTGMDGLSACYKEFENEEAWRERYWAAFESKNYQKIKAWEHEREYRIVINNSFDRYDDPNSRNLKYDFKSLKGIIFGIKTSEYDKKKIMEKILQKKDHLSHINFFQAEYDDEQQKISIREKALWKTESMHNNAIEDNTQKNNK